MHRTDPFFMKNRIGIITRTLAVITILTPLTLYSQQGIMKGVVADSATGIGIPFASVALQASGDTVPMAGTTATVEGGFILQGLRDGQYQLIISFIGYETVVVPNLSIELGIRELILDTIKLSVEAQVLQGMVVKAEAYTSSTGLDRRTYRVADFETALGGNASDVLNRLPSVSVSADGAVSIHGTSDIVVYLNGRPTQMEPAVLLAQISAGTIESIDIISVPTARYDAQGQGGIININTKTTRTPGLSISVNILGGGAPWNHDTEPITGYSLNDNRYGGGINLFYTRDKLRLFSTLNYLSRDVNSIRTGDARIRYPGAEVYRHMEAAGPKPEYYENISASFGVEYDLTSRSQVSGSIYYGNRKEWRQAFYLYHLYDGDVAKKPVAGIPADHRYVFNPNTGNRLGIFRTMNLDYHHWISSRSRLLISALYEYSLLSQEVDNPEINIDSASGTPGLYHRYFRQFDETPLHGYRMAVEFTTRLTDQHTLHVGFHPQRLLIDGGFNYDTLDVITEQWGAQTALENQIALSRTVMAGYTDLDGTWAGIQYRIGLRAEYTDQVLEIANPDYFTILDRDTRGRNVQQYFDLFPSVHLRYQLKGGDQLMAAASRRISRSPVKNMAPFLFRRHTEVYVVGDPELKPEYINLAEISYSKSIGAHRISVRGFYRGVENAVFRVNTIYPDEMVLIRSFTNSGHTRSLGGEMNLNMEYGSRTRLFVGASLYDYRVQAEIFGYQEDQRSLAWTVKGNIQVQLIKGLRAAADIDVRSGVVTAQGRDEMMYVANMSLGYTPPDKEQWSFALRGLNLLNSHIRTFHTRAFDAEGVQIFYQDTEMQWMGPIAELSITYNLNWLGDTRVRRTESEFGRREF